MNPIVSYSKIDFSEFLPEAGTKIFTFYNIDIQTYVKLAQTNLYKNFQIFMSVVTLALTEVGNLNCGFLLGNTPNIL